MLCFYVRQHAQSKLRGDISPLLTASKKGTTILELDQLVLMIALFAIEGQEGIGIF